MTNEENNDLPIREIIGCASLGANIIAMHGNTGLLERLSPSILDEEITIAVAANRLFAYSTFVNHHVHYSHAETVKRWICAYADKIYQLSREVEIANKIRCLKYIIKALNDLYTELYKVKFAKLFTDEGVLGRFLAYIVNLCAFFTEYKNALEYATATDATEVQS